MKKLVKGLHQFRSETFLSQKDLFERLMSGQTPDALFITCSDSRISPNLITHTEPGELFILRNAGNIVPPYGTSAGGEEATIEFAVLGLNVKDIIVCGHSDCGAIKGLLYPSELEKLPAMARWLRFADATKRIVEDVYDGTLSAADKLNIATQENVLVQLESLRTHPAVAVRLAKGELNLHGWTYKMQTGEVFSYNPDEGQFLPVSEVPAHTESAKRGAKTIVAI